MEYEKTIAEMIGESSMTLSSDFALVCSSITEQAQSLPSHAASTHMQHVCTCASF